MQGETHGQRTARTASNARRKTDAAAFRRRRPGTMRENHRLIGWSLALRRLEGFGATPPRPNSRTRVANPYPGREVFSYSNAGA